MSSSHAKGIDQVLANLNKELAKLKGNVQKGLTLAMLQVKGKSMAKTPVDVGNLRASHYLVTGGGTESGKSGSFKPDKKGGTKVASEHDGHVAEAKANAKSKGAVGPFAEVGCTAYYAVYVHENLEARHITGGAKFLERAFYEEESKIIPTVVRFAKL